MRGDKRLPGEDNDLNGCVNDASDWAGLLIEHFDFPEPGMKEVLLSAASDRQYATDAYIEGGYRGAMTYFAIRIIREANYEITYAELVGRLRDLIAANYSQDPQLEGRDENKRKRIFS